MYLRHLGDGTLYATLHSMPESVRRAIAVDEIRGFFGFRVFFCGRGGEMARNFAHEFLIRRNEVSSPTSEKGFFVERISSGLARLATCGERMKFGHFVAKTVQK